MTASDWAVLAGLLAFVAMVVFALLTMVAAATGDADAVRVYFGAVAVNTALLVILMWVTR